MRLNLFVVVLFSVILGNEAMAEDKDFMGGPMSISTHHLTKDVKDRFEKADKIASLNKNNQQKNDRRESTLRMITRIYDYNVARDVKQINFTTTQKFYTQGETYTCKGSSRRQEGKFCDRSIIMYNHWDIQCIDNRTNEYLTPKSLNVYCLFGNFNGLYYSN